LVSYKVQDSIPAQITKCEKDEQSHHQNTKEINSDEKEKKKLNYKARHEEYTKKKLDSTKHLIKKTYLF
jgi:hypothetical protein